MNVATGQQVADTTLPIGGTYPVSVVFPRQETYNRFWALPVLGYLIKSILLLPHLILGYFFYLVLAVVTLFLWVPVLITGRYPDWGYAFLGGALRWHARVLAYSFGLSDQYPSFSFAAGRAGQDTDVSYQRSLSASRFWAIPLVGFTIKCLFLIPHVILLYAIGLVAALLLLVSWVPVLFTGQYPEWGTSLIGGSIRWWVRVAAYFWGLTDRYPPFSLS